LLDYFSTLELMAAKETDMRYCLYVLIALLLAFGSFACNKSGKSGSGESDSREATSNTTEKGKADGKSDSKTTDIDNFLDEYEKTVVVWEEKAKSGTITVNDAIEMTEQASIWANKALEVNFAIHANQKQEERMDKLTERMQNASMLLSKKITGSMQTMQ